MSVIGCASSIKIMTPCRCDLQRTTTVRPSRLKCTLGVVSSTEGEIDSIQVDYNGTPVNAASLQHEIELNATARVFNSTLHMARNSTTLFEINNTAIFLPFVDAENEVCGSVCTISNHSLNTDTVEALSAEPTMIEELGNLYACNIGSGWRSFIVAHNDDYTHTCHYKVDGYDVPGGGYWENGFNNSTFP